MQLLNHVHLHTDLKAPLDERHYINMFFSCVLAVFLLSRFVRIYLIQIYICSI